MNFQALLIAAAFLLISPFPGGAEGKASLEDKTKAVFIYHFIRYIEWPQPDSSEFFEISVLGNSGVIHPLKEISKKKRANDRPIRVTLLQAPPDTLGSHILFISREEEKWLPEIRKRNRGATLVLGDTPGLVKRGAVFNFFISQGKIKFEVNKNALGSLDIKVSSQLLKLARIVAEENNHD